MYSSAGQWISKPGQPAGIFIRDPSESPTCGLTIPVEWFFTRIFGIAVTRCTPTCPLSVSPFVGQEVRCELFPALGHGFDFGPSDSLPAGCGSAETRDHDSMCRS